MSATNMATRIQPTPEAGRQHAAPIARRVLSAALSITVFSLLATVGLLPDAAQRDPVQVAHASAKVTPAPIVLLPKGACVPAPEDLVHWYPLDEPAGTVAADIAGGNDGQHVEGPQSVEAVVDRGLRFSGEQLVIAPHRPTLNFGAEGDFSLDAWVQQEPLHRARSARRARVAPLPATIVSKHEGGAGYSLQIDWVDQELTLILHANGGKSVHVGSGLSVPQDGQPHFVAVSVDRDEGLRFHVDGMTSEYSLAEVKKPGLGVDVDNGGPLLIGAVQSQSGPIVNFFNGMIDEVEIFGRALSVEELETIRRAGSAGKCKGDDPEPPTPEPSPACCLNLSFRDGNPDDFDLADGAESPRPSRGLVRRLDPKVGKDYDDPQSNTYFVHTFELPAGQCISDAVLRVRARPEGYAANDAMTLTFTDDDGTPSVDGNGDPYAKAYAFFGWGNGANSSGLGIQDRTWTADQYPDGRTFVVNLRNPPPGVFSGQQDWLRGLNELRRLDVIIQDDTTIDWLGLDVIVCDCGETGGGGTTDPTLEETATR